MDIRLIILLLIVATVILAILAIIRRSIKIGISILVLYVALTFVYSVLPIEAKASIDISLALTGSKYFAKVSEEHIAYVKDRGIDIKTTPFFSFAYPVYTTYQDAPPVTADNITDFNIDYFDTEKGCIGIQVMIQEKQFDKAISILTSMGFVVRAS